MTLARHFGSMPALQALLYLPAILALLILANIALRWSLADVYATQVSHHLDAGKKNASNQNAKQWRQARQHLERTLELRPAYARYFELAEAFYQRLDSLEFRRNPLIQELAWHDNALEALNYARRGLRLTPSWPYLWNKLVISKVLLKQFDNELTGGMERAVYLAPWEQSIQYGVAILGLNLWPSLQDTARLQVLQAIEQTLAMDQINHRKVYDAKKVLSHANFSQACEKNSMSMTQSQLHSYCP
ncbi:hypothetical protein [Methylomicrobium lacus]|uniref:hypothetical protein n=1 Tax=Methylomicrobium lacus TaxID=136992 RepID=UPI0035A924C8